MKLIPENNFDDVVSEIIDFFSGSDKYNCVTSILERHAVEVDLIKREDALNYAHDFASEAWDGIGVSAPALPLWDGK